MIATTFGSPVQVFISYAHANMAVVQDIVQRLGFHLHNESIKFFFDQTDRPTDDVDGLPFGLSEPMATSQVFLVFVSEDYLASRWCRAELQAFARIQVAKRRATEAFGKRIPVGWIVVVRIEPRGLLEGVSRTVEEAVGAANAAALLRAEYHIQSALGSTATEVVQEITNCIQVKQRDLAMIAPSTPDALWSQFGASFPWLLDIPIMTVITTYQRLRSADARVLARIEKHRRTEVVQLLTQITSPWVDVFNRPVGKELLNLAYPLGDLVEVVRNGEPVPVLVAMLRDGGIGLPELQYSYYQCVLDGWQHWLIDTAAIAAMAIAYDPAIPDWLVASFDSQLIEPLQFGIDLADIRWGTPSG
ncbi:MAG: toll/interleukin-1 receptor domain-containing protein [Deltaproteobacteria bacterium]|nr:toll/interleukin-1 receptor domain-containing protein [Deltaproteobacteria bacterium]